MARMFSTCAFEISSDCVFCFVTRTRSTCKSSAAFSPSPPVSDLLFISLPEIFMLLGRVATSSMEDSSLLFVFVIFPKFSSKLFSVFSEFSSNFVNKRSIEPGDSIGALSLYLVTRVCSIALPDLRKLETDCSLFTTTLSGDLNASNCLYNSDCR